MHIIVGLGNPEKRYRNTRHNVGFDVIDALAEQYHIRMNEKKHRRHRRREGFAGKAADLYELKRAERGGAVKIL